MCKGITTNRLELAAFTKRDTIKLEYLLVTIALSRAADYLFTLQLPAYYSDVEEIIPWPYVGLSFLAAGLLLLAGLVARRHLAVWLGHAILTCLNVGLVSGISYNVFVAEGEGFSRVPMAVMVLVAHIWILVRMGPVPLGADDFEKEEAETIMRPTRKV